mgnify:CR=1 FL=1
MHALLTNATAALARLAGLDVFIERDDPRCGLLDFAHQDHGKDGREVWGFGLHVVVSRLSR